VAAEGCDSNPLTPTVAIWAQLAYKASRAERHRISKITNGGFIIIIIIIKQENDYSDVRQL